MLFAFGAIIVACNNIKQQFTDGDANTENLPEEPSTKSVIIPEQHAKRYLKNDFNNNGTKDSIVLTVDAEKDDLGRLMWSDGHVWNVYFKEKDKVVKLYGQLVQLGHLELYHTAEADVVPQIYIKENGPHSKKIYQIKNPDTGLLVEVDTIPSYGQKTTIDD